MNNLAKAMDPQDKEALKSSHIVGNAETVDHTFHTSKSGTPSPLKKLFNTPDIVPKALSIGGASPKVIHDVSNFVDPKDPKDKMSSNIIMSKPYHQETSLNSNLPIYGWATMTNNKLYQAAGMPHMTEEVHAGEHEGIPLTHHVFADPSFKEFDHYAANGHNETPLSPDLHDVHRIALMDYLTNNLDRHNSNLLINSKNGKDLMGIDHDRSFQYNDDISHHRTKEEGDFQGELPAHYLDNSVPLRNLAEASHNWEDDHDKKMSDWWNQHKDAIKNEFLANASAIKDPRIRDHVTDNFMSRHNRISDWAKPGTEGNFETHSLFSDMLPNPTPIKPFSDRIIDTQEFLKPYLHQPPVQIASAVMKQLRQSPQMSLAFNGVMKELNNQMSPDEISDVMITHNDQLNSPAMQALIWKQPKDKLIETMKSLHSKIKKFPDEGRNLMPFVHRFMDKVNQGQDPFKKEGTLR